MDETSKAKYDEIIEKLIHDFNEKDKDENLESYNIDTFLSETQELLSKYSHMIDLTNLQTETPKDLKLSLSQKKRYKFR